LLHGRLGGFTGAGTCRLLRPCRYRPPSFATPERVLHVEPATTPSGPAAKTLVWLSGHAIFQTVTASAFGGLITGWIAISAALVGAFTYAVAMCLIVPVLGWFIGLPIVLVTGMMVAMCWLGALGALLFAWALVALYGLVVGLIAQMLATRR
jgi:hypothetical protein